MNVIGRGLRAWGRVLRQIFGPPDLPPAGSRERIEIDHPLEAAGALKQAARHLQFVGETITSASCPADPPDTLKAALERLAENARR